MVLTNSHHPLPASHHPPRRNQSGRSDRTGPKASRGPTRSESAQRAAELARRWRQEGDRGARDELFQQFLPLARGLAGRYVNRIDQLEDLIQVASMGLLLAVNRFDPNRGPPFVAFAVPTIVGEIKRYFRSTAWSAHVPRDAQELAVRVGRAEHELEALTGHSPTVHEVAQHTGVSVDDVREGRDALSTRYALPLDAPAADTVCNPLSETLGNDDRGYELVETKLTLIAALSLLPIQERQAILLRLADSLSQREIGRRLGCSQMQVSRLLRRASIHIHRVLDSEPDWSPVQVVRRSPQSV